LEIATNTKALLSQYTEQLISSTSQILKKFLLNVKQPAEFQGMTEKCCRNANE